jgi:hypothetical protein
VSDPVEKPWSDAVAAELLRMFPPKMRAAIVETPEFEGRFDLGGDAVLTLNAFGAKFLRSTLFDTCRQILSGGAAEAEVTSNQGEVWKVTAAQPFGIMLSRGESSVILQEMSCLSPTTDLRIAWFDDQADVYGDSDAYLAEWRDRLAQSRSQTTRSERSWTNLGSRHRLCSPPSVRTFRAARLDRSIWCLAMSATLNA